jgi:hypothetical protein
VGWASSPWGDTTLQSCLRACGRCRGSTGATRGRRDGDCTTRRAVSTQLVGNPVCAHYRRHVTPGVCRRGGTLRRGSPRPEPSHGRIIFSGSGNPARKRSVIIRPRRVPESIRAVVRQPRDRPHSKCSKCGYACAQCSDCDCGRSWHQNIRGSLGIHEFLKPYSYRLQSCARGGAFPRGRAPRARENYREFGDIFTGGSKKDTNAQRP